MAAFKLLIYVSLIAMITGNYTSMFSIGKNIIFI